jgi:hypothetical protein
VHRQNGSYIDCLRSLQNLHYWRNFKPSRELQCLYEWWSLWLSLRELETYISKGFREFWEIRKCSDVYLGSKNFNFVPLQAWVHFSDSVGVSIRSQNPTFSQIVRKYWRTRRLRFCKIELNWETVKLEPNIKSLAYRVVRDSNYFCKYNFCFFETYYWYIRILEEKNCPYN